MGRRRAEVGGNAGSKLAGIRAGKEEFCLFGWLEESDVGLELRQCTASRVQLAIVISQVGLRRTWEGSRCSRFDYSLLLQRLGM